jgi:hypothetical protein
MEQSPSGAHPGSYVMGNGSKAIGTWSMSDHLPTYIAEVKKGVAVPPFHMSSYH